jgi:hypothetical protein
LIDLLAHFRQFLQPVFLVIQAFEEEQVGKLFDGIEWIGKLPCPELIP